jgi:hypothetical protein
VDLADSLPRSLFVSLPYALELDFQENRFCRDDAAATNGTSKYEAQGESFIGVTSNEYREGSIVWSRTD